MKIVTITLLVGDNLDSGPLTADEIANSVVAAMVDAQAENPWGGMNGVPVYIEGVLNVNVFDAGAVHELTASTKEN